MMGYGVRWWGGGGSGRFPEEGERLGAGGVKVADGRPLGEAWLRVGAIIAEFSMG